MTTSGVIPIATALAAAIATVALGLGRGRAARTVWALLLPLVVTACVGWYAARVFGVLPRAALSTATVMTCAALVFGIRAGDARRRAPPAGLANVALWLGLGVIAILVMAWRDDRGALLAAIPAGIGVLAIWLGGRALSHRSGPVAFETVLALMLALGAVACASIAAGGAAPAPLGTLGRATSFALAPALSAGLVLGSRVAELGRAVPGRVPELVATVGLLVLAAAAFRVELGGTRRAEPATASAPRPTPTKIVVVPPSPPPPAPVAVRDAEPPPPAPDAAAAPEGVVFDEVRVSGMLAPNEVQRGVEKLRPRIEKCRDQAQGARGRIDVRFSIGPTGSVTSVQSDPDSDLAPALAGCILASFYQVGFPQPTRGNVRVEAPIRIGE